MTDQQWEMIERSLIGLSPGDKPELVERLVHELRDPSASCSPSPGPCVAPTSEDEFKRHLLNRGLISSLPVPADPATRPAYRPIAIEGEPLSDTIIRERR